MRLAQLSFAVAALMLVIGHPLGARGNAVTVRIEISGGRLAGPVAVTDQPLLELSSVYAGAFLGPVISAIDPNWDRYQVVLLSEARTFAPELALTGVRKPYLLHYAMNPETREGFVYLPARGEDGYRGNISIIIRDGHDGRWHHAFPIWAELLNAHILRR
jgi:hypothetical protein